MADTDQEARMKEYFSKRVSTAVDPDLLDYAIDELLSRTMLYLNMDSVPQKFEMALVNILVSQMTLYASDTSESNLKKIEDNGQAITYGEQLLNFFATQPDNVVFSGTAGVLGRYRLANVVGEELYEDTSDLE